MCVGGGGEVVLNTSILLFLFLSVQGGIHNFRDLCAAIWSKINFGPIGNYHP
jgi:hypothetical protein